MKVHRAMMQLSRCRALSATREEARPYCGCVDLRSARRDGSGAVDTSIGIPADTDKRLQRPVFLVPWHVGNGRACDLSCDRVKWASGRLHDIDL